MAKREITLTFKTDEKDLDPVSFEVSDGLSAYEMWKAQPGNEDKTEADFLNSLKGEPGKTESITGVSISVKEV